MNTEHDSGGTVAHESIKLSRAALDWAVGQCQNRELYRSKSGRWMTADYGQFNHRHGAPWWNPSTNWEQGGPIIEREGIALTTIDCAPNWEADIGGTIKATGPTPLVAAMRAYVHATLGDTVHIPRTVVEAS